ncbi:unnamed protein product [Trifolium pratense]|uniref:Uncharacterized protein n=1 Tax=Trifolium pratense TaxID=57577 RepID=A0ACB0IB93_TRIPR|nr:unnamed protein product [Trifolium pratense]
MTRSTRATASSSKQRNKNKNVVHIEEEIETIYISSDDEEVVEDRFGEWGWSKEVTAALGNWRKPQTLHVPSWIVQSVLFHKKGIILDSVDNGRTYPCSILAPPDRGMFVRYLGDGWTIGVVPVKTEPFDAIWISSDDEGDNVAKGFARRVSRRVDRNADNNGANRVDKTADNNGARRVGKTAVQNVAPKVVRKEKVIWITPVTKAMQRLKKKQTLHIPSWVVKQALLGKTEINLRSAQTKRTYECAILNSGRSLQRYIGDGCRYNSSRKLDESDDDKDYESTASTPKLDRKRAAKKKAATATRPTKPDIDLTKGNASAPAKIKLKFDGPSTLDDFQYDRITRKLFCQPEQDDDNDFYLNYHPISSFGYEGADVPLYIPEWMPMTFRPARKMCLNDICTYTAAYVFMRDDEKLLGMRWTTKINTTEEMRDKEQYDGGDEYDGVYGGDEYDGVDGGDEYDGVDGGDEYDGVDGGDEYDGVDGGQRRVRLRRRRSRENTVQNEEHDEFGNLGI